MTKINYQKAALWVALLLALLGSLQHTAWSFTTLEQGNLALGYIQAVAVEIGLAALAFGIQQKKKQKRSTKWLWIGVASFSLISAYANLLHGLVYSSPLNIQASWRWMDTLRPILLSAVLPALVIYLAEIVSGEQVYNQEQEEKAQKKAGRALQIYIDPVSNSEKKGIFPAPIEQARQIKLDQLRASKGETLDKILDILDTDPEIEITELSNRVNRSRTTVYSYLQELEESGKLRKNGKGFRIENSRQF